MKSKVIDKNTASKYTWGNNCISNVLMDTTGLSVKQEVMPGNTKEQLHYHNIAQQFFYILEGEAQFHIEEETVILSRQQGIHIEAGIRHFIENKTNDTLEFLVISQPATTNDRITIE